MCKERNSRRSIERLDSALQNLKINFGDTSWLVEWRSISDLCAQIEKHGKKPKVIGAYGKNLQGLLSIFQGLFPELFKDGEKLQFTILSPEHVENLSHH